MTKISFLNGKYIVADCSAGISILDSNLKIESQVLIPSGVMDMDCHGDKIVTNSFQNEIQVGTYDQSYKKSSFVF